MRTKFRRLLLLACALRYGARLLWRAAPAGEKVHWIVALLTDIHQSRSARGLLRRALPELGPLAGALVESTGAQPGQGVQTWHEALELAGHAESALTRPLPRDEVPAALRAALAHPLEALFAEIDWTPLESGIGVQVHAARLREPPRGKWHGEVVVKLLRRGQVQRIDDDLTVLRWLAALLETISPGARKLRLRALAESFSADVMRRFDLRCEAANLSQTRRHFRDDARIVVPDVVWAYTTDEAIVIERIETLSVTDLAGLAEYGVSLERLAVDLFRLAVEQAFEHGFFHAVLNASRVRVSVDTATRGRLVLADCSVMSTLTEQERAFFIHGATALFNQQYGNVAGMHHDAGHVTVQARPEKIEAELRVRTEPHFARQGSRRTAAELLRHLAEVVEPFGGAVPPALALAGRSLAQAESLTRTLAPELDSWRLAQTALAALARKDVDHRGWIEHLSRELPHFAPIAPRLPLLFANSLQQARDRQRQRAGDTHTWLRELTFEQQRMRRLVFACAATGLLFGAVLVWLV